MGFEWQSYNPYGQRSGAGTAAAFASFFEQMSGDGFGMWVKGAPGEGTGPGEMVVDQGLREKMEMRRMGNICAWARDEGWTARLATNSRGYCVQFRGPKGEMVVGPQWEGSERRALYVGCERLAERVFNAETQRGKGAERETK